MRIRKAALAGATAIAVAFSGASAAMAADGATPTTPVPAANQDKDGQGSAKTDDSQGSAQGNGSNLAYKLGNKLEADKDVNGSDVLGSSKNFDNVPAWAKALYGIGIASAVVTVVAGLVGPVLNFIKYGPLKF